MCDASTVTNGGLRPNDPRWQRVWKIGEIIAIILDIDEHRKFINSHALHAHPLEVAVNLRQIHQEAEGMGVHIEKIKRFLWQLQALTEEDIYQTWNEKPRNEDRMSNGNGKQTTKIKTHRQVKTRPRPKYRGGSAKSGRPRKG